MVPFINSENLNTCSHFPNPRNTLGKNIFSILLLINTWCHLPFPHRGVIKTQSHLRDTHTLRADVRKSLHRWVQITTMHRSHCDVKEEELGVRIDIFHTQCDCHRLKSVRDETNTKR